MKTILLAGGGVAALLSATSAFAQSETSATPGEEIIVTGTRATRTVASSLAPIDVLSPADLQTSGKQSVRDLLSTLVPSISVSNSGAGASFAVKTLSLRGLSGDQVLVLVNGKRRHNTATLFINGTTQNGQSPPDLDLIPASAISQIEVLRDGASAQYGSDAIAGVINLILRDKTGGEANVLGGRTYNGGGETGQTQAVVGFAFGEGGFVDVALDARYQARTYRGGPNQTIRYPLVNGGLDPRETTANRYTSHPGQPQVQTLDLSYNAGLPLGDNIQLYSFSTVSARRSDAWLTYRNPSASNNILEVYPEGYSPRLRIYDTDSQVAAGLKGSEGPLGFDWDLSSTYGYDRANYHEASLNASLGPASPKDFYLGQVIATEWTSDLDLRRTFDLGTAQPVLVALGAQYRQNSYEIQAGEPASYNDGGYRSATGTYANVARISGAQGVTGFPASAAGTFRRHNVALYGDVEDTILPGWDVALAGRFEHYSDAGDTKTGKASTRIEPVHGLAFRATVSTGFRAPTLQQQHYASSSTIGVVVNGISQLLPVQALPVDSPAAIALGAEPLKPERSTNVSAGIVFTAVPHLNITVDAYQIKIRDRILLSGTLSGAAVNAALAAAGITTATSGFYFSNAADTRTRGLDVVATYRLGLGRFGAAVLNASANFNKTIFTNIDSPPAALAAAGLVLIDRARQGDFTQGTPRNKQIASVDWTLGKFGATVRATRYGKVVQTSTNPANDDVVPSKVIFDLNLNYALTKSLKLTVGANNLFNIYPPVLKLANRGQTTNNAALAALAGLPTIGASNTAYYNSYAPYGVSGGFWYARLNFSF